MPNHSSCEKNSYEVPLSFGRKDVRIFCRRRLPGHELMPLKLRSTGLGSGIDKDRPDYTVYCGGWDVGRIYQTRGGLASLRWFWSLTVNGPMTRSDRVATLDEAKGQFQKRWDACRLGRSWKRCHDFRRPRDRLVGFLSELRPAFGEEGWTTDRVSAIAALNISINKWRASMRWIALAAALCLPTPAVAKSSAAVLMKHLGSQDEQVRTLAEIALEFAAAGIFWANLRGRSTGQPSLYCAPKNLALQTDQLKARRTRLSPDSGRPAGPFGAFRQMLATP